MFDVWIGDINVAELTLLFSILIILPVQLLLCFKVNSLAIRLLPVLIFSVLMGICGFMALVTPGWDGLGYLFFVFYAGIWVFACGIGWAVWVVIRHVKSKNH